MAATGKFRQHALAILVVFIITLTFSAYAKKKSGADSTDAADKWKKKDVRDYTDADLERLFEQWEVGVSLTACVDRVPGEAPRGPAPPTALGHVDLFSSGATAWRGLKIIFR